MASISDSSNQKTQVFKWKGVNVLINYQYQCDEDKNFTLEKNALSGNFAIFCS